MGRPARDKAGETAAALEAYEREVRPGLDVRDVEPPAKRAALREQRGPTDKEQNGRVRVRQTLPPQVRAERVRQWRAERKEGAWETPLVD